ncbi:MAG: hypothetical protein LBQ74_13875 [Prevotella sp.]|jgi:hypothetical protein|nr:hypothetical protein [Prevotella sp.]
MTQEERFIIEYKAKRILDSLNSQNLADMPLPLFHGMVNEFHILTTILDNQSIDVKKK